MKTWIITAWERINASYWFVPAIMVSMAIGLSFLATAIDHRLQIENPSEWQYIYTGGADGARQLFSTVAASMITVAGVVFSVTVLTLTLAAQQLGSRILHNFMRDTGNQVVLGTFLSTFVYCLLALRTVRGGEENSFVPHVGVTIAVVLTMASVIVFIYFIHHVAASINPATMIAAVGAELDHAVDHLFPEKIGHEPEGGSDNETGRRDPFVESDAQVRAAVCARSNGYVEYLDGDSLIARAKECEWIVRAFKRPGSLVVEGDLLAQIFAAEEPDDDDLLHVRQTFAIGHERTSHQDLIFPISQILQVAQRALSPSLNDPNTAMLCIDRLGIFLKKLTGRRDPSGRRNDSEGALRLITRPYTFADAIKAAFDPIREHAAQNIQVGVRMLETLKDIAERAQTPEQADAIRCQVLALEECIKSNNHLCAHDRETLLQWSRKALSALDAAEAREGKHSQA